MSDQPLKSSAQGKMKSLKKIDPILFDFMRTLYWSLGEVAGKPWSAGKVLKKV
jgi:hypothetical protein